MKSGLGATCGWLPGTVSSARVSLLELDAGIREFAATVESPVLRTLDALHLASAVSLEDDLGAIACYDERLSGAAELEGIAVVSPT